MCELNPGAFCPRPPTLESVECELLQRKQVILDVLRLDLIDPYLHGNKWYKLKYTLEAARKQGVKTLVSFGGAYSNHLYALAAAGAYFGFSTVGYVRGELVEPLNPVLAFARSQGMKLVPLSRQAYRDKNQAWFMGQLKAEHRSALIIPEGGSNDLSLKGCAEIVDELKRLLPETPITVAMACGTGATISGVIEGMLKQPEGYSALGFSVLKAPGMITAEIQRRVGDSATAAKLPWYVSDSFHCGGYARSSPELMTFISDFAEISPIPLEPVYTGKLLFGLFSMIEEGAFPPGSHIVALHSGGIVSVKP